MQSQVRKILFLGNLIFLLGIYNNSIRYLPYKLTSHIFVPKDNIRAPKPHFKPYLPYLRTELYLRIWYRKQFINTIVIKKILIVKNGHLLFKQGKLIFSKYAKKYSSPNQK